jgi:hypothetical protein
MEEGRYIEQIGAGMRRLFERPVILIGVIMVLVLPLGVANYGVLLHEHIVPPPIVDIALGPYSVRSWVDYEPRCGAHPYCQGIHTQVFYVSFIHNRTAPARPQTVQFLRLPLASPQ